MTERVETDAPNFIEGKGWIPTYFVRFEVYVEGNERPSIKQMNIPAWYNPTARNLAKAQIPRIKEEEGAFEVRLRDLSCRGRYIPVDDDDDFVCGNCSKGHPPPIQRRRHSAR